MSVDMFIKIEKIAGESADAAHAGEIDVLSWSWGATQSATTHSGSGGGSGKVHVQDLTFTKRIDKASPALFAYCCSGMHLADALLIVRKAGGDAPVDYVKVKMEEVLISSYTTGGVGQSDELHETVTLNFGRVTFEYTPQAAKGTKAASIPKGWDIAKNKAI
jgi:type VI secretion system secreted protein Hcp